MVKYRKKPVVIDAMLWDGTVEDATPIIDWILSEGGTARFHETPENAILIDTLEGSMWTSPGDFVIRGVQGEFYPCKPDIFEKTYETATTAHLCSVCHLEVLPEDVPMAHEQCIRSDAS